MYHLSPCIVAPPKNAHAHELQPFRFLKLVALAASL